MGLLESAWEQKEMESLISNNHSAKTIYKAFVKLNNGNQLVFASTSKKKLFDKINKDWIKFGYKSVSVTSSDFDYRKGI